MRNIVKEKSSRFTTKDSDKLQRGLLDELRDPLFLDSKEIKVSKSNLVRICHTIWRRIYRR